MNENNMNNGQGTVQYVPAKCTNCGGELAVDPSQECAICQFCGTPFIVANAVKNYNIQNNTYNTNIVNDQRKGTVESILNYASEQQDKKYQRQEEQRIRREEKQKSAGKTILWILGWLIIFPVPLTILMLRNRTMNKNVRYGIIAAAWIIYLMIGFSGRSRRTENTDRTVVTETSIAVEETTTAAAIEEPVNNNGDLDFIVGTYFGADGSILVIFENNIADYYFGGTMEKSLAWKYEDNILTWHSDKMECDIYAEIKGNKTDLLLFKSKSSNWSDEEYVKLSDTAKEMTVEECRAVLQEIKNSLESSTALTTAEGKSDINDTDAESAVKNGDYSLVTPSFKKTMDDYEAFYDDYIAFMKKYSTSDDMVSMLNDYTEMMNKLDRWSKEINAIDTNKLSAADRAYYLLVTVRVNNKLMNAAY